MRQAFSIILLSLPLLFSGCGSCCSGPLCHYTPHLLTGIEREIIRTINTWALFAKKEFDVQLCASYTTFEEGERLVWLDFYTQEIDDVCAARRKMVWLIDSLLEKLNQMELLEHPLTFEHLYVSVEYTSYYGKYVDPLYVGRMELQEGFLSCFYAHTALDPNSVIQHNHCEPFVTSREIVYSVHEEMVKRAEEKKEALIELFEECREDADTQCLPPDEREFRVRYETDSYWLGD